MMNRYLMLTLTLLLAACEETKHYESAEELLKNPERLKELQTQCRYDREKVGNAQCVAVSEALGKKVMGKGTPYTPQSVNFYGN